MLRKSYIAVILLCLLPSICLTDSFFSRVMGRSDSSSPFKLNVKLSLPEGPELQKTISSAVDAVGKSLEGTPEVATDAIVSGMMRGGLSGIQKEIGGFESEFKKEIVPHLASLQRDVVDTILNPRNMFQYGGIMGGTVAIALAGHYGSKIAWRMLENYLFNPKPDIIVKEANPKFGRWDRFSRRWNKYTSPVMIFNTSVKERLEEIEKKAKIIKNLIRQGKNITYDNLLLYGKPGTGKTLFAQVLADKTDMDFLPVTAASLLQSGVEGIKYFDEIIALANKSAYGTIIFIDEADALFVDRNMLKPDSDHYKVLNHILAATGTGKRTYMIIAATNHAYVMDEAMGRRFQDRVFMPLPDAATRLELITVYCNKTLLNPAENSASFVATAKKLLSPAVIKNIVNDTDGLSHAEIKDMVSTINKAAQIAGITQTIIEQTVKNAVQKNKILEEEKEQRQKRFFNNASEVPAA